MVRSRESEDVDWKVPNSSDIVSNRAKAVSTNVCLMAYPQCDTVGYRRI